MFFFLFFLLPTRLSQNKQNLSSDSPVPWDCLQLRSLSSNAPSENFCVRYDGKMLATKFVEYLVTVRQGTRNPEKKARMTDTAPCPPGVQIQCHIVKAVFAEPEA